MVRRPLRIAATPQLQDAVRRAGFEVYPLPGGPDWDIHRPVPRRVEDGKIILPFLEKHDIDLVVDYDTAALTFIQPGDDPTELTITPAALSIPYASLYLDPITSTMNQVPWPDHWQVLESPTWIKCIWEQAHCKELATLGVPNAIPLPIGVADDDFDTAPPEPDENGPVLAFVGHPATTWFQSNRPLLPKELFTGLTAAAVAADMPDITFHQFYFGLYEIDRPPTPTDPPDLRAQKALAYFQRKFAYNAYLAIKQRDRFVHFLQKKLGDAFLLVGDYWGETYGLDHRPRIWDKKELYALMRRVPICLNLTKGCAETGLNLRHFEITAAGGFLLTYHMPELADHFDIGVECETFRDEQELLEKVHHYLTHPKERREIAHAGQQRTLSRHLAHHRIAALVETLRQAGVLPGSASATDADRPEASTAPAKA